jgi:hypothetical protein
MSDPRTILKDRPPAEFCRYDTGNSVGNPCVSEGGLGPRSWWYITETVIYHQSKITRNGAPGPAFPPENSGGAV